MLLMNSVVNTPVSSLQYKFGFGQISYRCAISDFAQRQRPERLILAFGLAMCKRASDLALNRLRSE